MVEELERIRKETGATEVSITFGPVRRIQLTCEWERLDSPPRRLKCNRQYFPGMIDEFIAEAKEFAKRGGL